MKKRKKSARFPHECHLIPGAKAVLAFLGVSLSLTKSHKTRDLGLDGSQKPPSSFGTLHEYRNKFLEHLNDIKRHRSSFFIQVLRDQWKLAYYMPKHPEQFDDFPTPYTDSFYLRRSFL